MNRRFTTLCVCAALATVALFGYKLIKVHKKAAETNQERVVYETNGQVTVVPPPPSPSASVVIEGSITRSNTAAK